MPDLYDFYSNSPNLDFSSEITIDPNMEYSALLELIAKKESEHMRRFQVYLKSCGTPELTEHFKDMTFDDIVFEKDSVIQERTARLMNTPIPFTSKS